MVTSVHEVVGTVQYTFGTVFYYPGNYNIWRHFGPRSARYTSFYCSYRIQYFKSDYS
jgi:hypothetical protein